METKNNKMYMANVRKVGGNANIKIRVGGNAKIKICVVGNANFNVFRYQHVGIPNAKLHVGGLSQHKDPTQMSLSPNVAC